MSTNSIISAEKVASLKAAAKAAAEAVKAAAEKGTKLPAAQWAARDHFETEGTALLRSLLDQGCVVASVGKPTKTKSGELSVGFKISAKQATLATKVETYVTAQMNARAKRKAKREAEQAAKELAAKAKAEAEAKAKGGAAPAPAPVIPMKGDAALAELASVLPMDKAA